MRVVAIIVGVVCIVAILQDSFETIVLPRKVSRRFRPSRWFYISGWKLWRSIGRMIRKGARREVYLSYFGPLSLILLLVLWVCVLMLAFALLNWGCASPVTSQEKVPSFGTYLYLSGTTFITLGLGDVAPLSVLGRVLTVIEAGTGFGFLALIIGYVPVIYQAFSRRETAIALLDARAGSPPTATEFLLRHAREQGGAELLQFLRSWESWSAELLESHLSYPVLTYYRSQHERQSWISALTMILDICALLIVGIDEIPTTMPRFVFAIARHAAVDLAQVFKTPPLNPKLDRLQYEEFERMRTALADAGLHFRDEATARERLYDLRLAYEPFVLALSNNLLIEPQPWIAATRTADDWQTSAWDHFAQWSPAKLAEITNFIAQKKGHLTPPRLNQRVHHGETPRHKVELPAPQQATGEAGKG